MLSPAVVSSSGVWHPAPPRSTILTAQAGGGVVLGSYGGGGALGGGRVAPGSRAAAASLAEANAAQGAGIKRCRQPDWKPQVGVCLQVEEQAQEVDHLIRKFKQPMTLFPLNCNHHSTANVRRAEPSPQHWTQQTQVGGRALRRQSTVQITVRQNLPVRLALGYCVFLV